MVNEFNEADKNIKVGNVAEFVDAGGRRFRCPVWKVVSMEGRCPDGPKGHFDECGNCPFNK